jgi:hypothetical protein
MVAPIPPATNVPSMVRGSGTGSELSSAATSVELKAPSQILILSTKPLELSPPLVAESSLKKLAILLMALKVTKGNYW